VTVYIALGLLLALVALLFVLLPVLRPGPSAREAGGDGREREAQRRELYRQILEIEFDQRTGKIDPDDARQLSERLLARAAWLLSADGRPSTDGEAAAEIEREVAALRRALEGAPDRQLGPART
jgi:cytochrome c-type biogenesis protein CcmI